MSYIAERRQEEKDRRRSEIVDAAAQLYQELGWDAVTMDGVARRARLSRALVYVYFKDKRDLYFAIAVRAMEMLRDRFADASAQHEVGLDKVIAIGRAYVAFAEELPHYFDACARLEMHAPEDEQHPERSAITQDIGRSVHRILEQALETGQRDQSVRANLGNRAITARVLWGFTHGLIQIALTKSRPMARSGVTVPQLMHQGIELMRHSLAGPKA
jgi:AcrR family transcriptional regulator